MIREYTKAVCNRHGRPHQWSSHKADEVEAYIGADCPILWDRPPLDTLNVANGLLDVHGLVLRPHSPDFLSPVQLPVLYDPGAKCAAVKRFVRETFPEDARDLAFAVVAWLMLPHTSLQKALLLIGSGCNGKSVYLSWLVRFLGRANCAGVSLHKLESDRFATARLVGKLANVCSDLPAHHLSGTSVFKALTGGDRLVAEAKYRDSFEFDPFCRLVFSANHPPQSPDSSEAFFRRWLVVPFARSFEGRERRREDLDAELAQPGELSGALNEALRLVSRVHARGIAETASMREAWSDLRARTDSVSVWLERATLVSSSAWVPKSELLRTYTNDCHASGRPVLTATALGISLKKARPAVMEAKRMVGDQRLSVWIGIALKDDRVS